MAKYFYGNLFTAEPYNPDDVLAAIPGKVTSDMNVELTKPRSEKEIKTALLWELLNLPILTATLPYSIKSIGPF
jgi:hypothetical protein